MAENERKRGRKADSRPNKPKKAAPEVAYTPGREFNRSRLVLNVLTVFAVVFAIFLGLSIFFKVETVTVSGNHKYSEWTVYEAAEIREGDSLLFFGQANASSKIIDRLPYVEYVRFELELPGTVHIIIEEAPVAYSLQAEDGSWWLMTAQGRVTEQINAAAAGDSARIIGLQLQKPVAGEAAVAAEAGEGSVTGADRLAVVLEIAAQLEKSELFGKVTSIDVSGLQSIEFWCGQQYQVKLGDRERLDYKIAAVKSVIEEMSDYQTGILDASFTTFPNSVGYMQFQN